MHACIDVRKQGVNKLCIRQKTDALKEKKKKEIKTVNTQLTVGTLQITPE